MVLRCLGLTVLKKLFLKWVGKWRFAILLNACEDRDLSLSCICVCVLPAAWTGLGKAKIMAHSKNENDIFLKNSSADVWFWGLWSSWISLWNTDGSNNFILPYASQLIEKEWTYLARLVLPCAGVTCEYIAWSIYVSAAVFELLMEKKNPSVPPDRPVQYLAGSPLNLVEDTQDYFWRI